MAAVLMAPAGTVTVNAVAPEPTETLAGSDAATCAEDEDGGGDDEGVGGDDEDSGGEDEDAGGKTGSLGGGAGTWAYVALAEHAEEFPAVSVARAWNTVVELSETLTEKPGDAKAAAVPLAIGAAEQSAPVYRLTIEPASAFPDTFGWFSLLPEPGDVARLVGAAGAVASSM
jgi:hypothetical protein